MQRRRGFYEKYGKRFLDIVCALLALILFSWLYLIVAILVRVRLGSPVLFRQLRPGMIDPATGQERIFPMYKFRTMTDERDAEGRLLPDDVRLTSFGSSLRATSLDELPEAINILKGDMSVVGPRPQLVRDMVFMTEAQRTRHTVKPGLTGLAQVSGRNAIDWETKLAFDLKYIEHISLWGDIRIIFRTVQKALIRQEGVSQDNMATAEDFGDSLLRKGQISEDIYRRGQEEALRLLEGTK